MLCRACNKKGAQLRHELNICDRCFDPSADQLICQTDAMARFALSKKDLQNLDHALAFNTHNGSHDTKLYLLTDLENAAIEKYGSIDELQETLDRRHRRRDETRRRKIQAQRQRRTELHNYLIDIGLPGIRGDSTICQEYIEIGEASEWTPRSIGIVMQEMEFFYKKTNYPHILRKVRNETRRDWGHYVPEEEIRDEAKEVALREYVDKHHENPHQMIMEIPPSLKDDANQHIQKYFQKGSKNKVILDDSSELSRRDLLEEIEEVLHRIDQEDKELENLFQKFLHDKKLLQLL